MLKFDSWLLNRCPAYTSIPPYCHMTKQNGECCSKPVCDFTTQQGSFSGTGSISGKGVGKMTVNITSVSFSFWKGQGIFSQWALLAWVATF